jgi:uncharacterized linocin/CFP29 family protein
MNGILTARQYLDAGGSLEVGAMRPYFNARGQAMFFNAEAGREQVAQNALLRRYEWETIDAAVIDVMRQPMVGISDLLAAGLTRPLGGLGAIISTYEQLSDMSDADVSMDVTPRKGERDRVAFEPQSIPVPIISKPFTLSRRHLEASRKMGESLDVTQTRVATIKVRQALESMLFSGSGKQMQGFKIYGYTTLPQRDTDTAANYGGGDFGTDGNAHKTIVGMMTALQSKGFFGPYGFYVASDQYADLLKLTGVNLTETQLSVILRTIPDLRFVKRTSELASGNAVLVQLTAEVVDLAIGQDVTPVQWAEEGGMIAQFRILTAAVPRLKFDGAGNAGIAHATSC